jgi:hypothetical protein
MSIPLMSAAALLARDRIALIKATRTIAPDLSDLMIFIGSDILLCGKEEEEEEEET